MAQMRIDEDRKGTTGTTSTYYGRNIQKINVDSTSNLLFLHYGLFLNKMLVKPKVIIFLEEISLCFIYTILVVAKLLAIH